MAERDQAEAKRFDLVRNERLKLAATYLNGIAIALVAVGGFSPFVAFITSGAATGQAAFALLAVCAIVSVALHYIASSLLKGLRL